MAPRFEWCRWSGDQTPLSQRCQSLIINRLLTVQVIAWRFYVALQGKICILSGQNWSYEEKIISCLMSCNPDNKE